MNFDEQILQQNYQAVVNQLTTYNEQYNKNTALLAVSKTKPAAMIAHLVGLGQQHFGENYLQEALEKMAVLQELPITWHYIGSIQRNKTKDIAKHFDWVHTLEREIIATRLNEQRAGLPPLNVLIQVNIDDEASKSGCQPDELPKLVSYILTCPNLALRGLMVIPSKAGGDAFARTQALFEQIKQSHNPPHWDSLSMGMSGDMSLAVEHGSTMVRVGTAIFGERHYA